MALTFIILVAWFGLFIECSVGPRQWARWWRGGGGSGGAVRGGAAVGDRRGAVHLCKCWC